MLRAERDKMQAALDRLTDWMTGKGWSHCTTEVELMEQVDDIEAERDRLRAANEKLIEALEPFAEFADPNDMVPANLPIAMGSSMAKQQLTMGDCYKARFALKDPGT